jgi:dihydrofolate reductase
MRHVVLFSHVSLDGFTEGPDGGLDWITVDDEGWDAVIALQETADAALFGRVNYEGFEGYWPTAAENPSATPHEVAHARWLEQADRVVFSKTLETVNWKGTRIVRDDLAGAIASMKQQPGKDMLLFGGANIAQTLMKLGLIDEFHLMVNPVILGGGKPLFQGLTERIPLKLVNAKTFGSGVVALHYQLDRS